MSCYYIGTGVFGKEGEIQTILCVGFGSNDVVYSGTLSGDVYIWRGSKLDRVVQGAHNVSTNCNLDKKIIKKQIKP